MSSTHVTLGFDDIGIAWRFVDECADEDPRTWGPDAVSSQATRGRDGVFRTRPAAVDFTSFASRHHAEVELEPCDEGYDPEDDLVAQLDAARVSDDDDEPDQSPWIDAAPPSPDERRFARVTVTHRARRHHEPLRVS